MSEDDEEPEEGLCGIYVRDNRGPSL